MTQTLTQNSTHPLTRLAVGVWLAGWVHLLAITALLAWQPARWTWLETRDAAGLTLALFATAWSTLPNLLTRNPTQTTPRQLSNLKLGSLILPWIVWIGLLGHMSITAQTIACLTLVALTYSQTKSQTKSPTNHNSTTTPAASKKNTDAELTVTESKRHALDLDQPQDNTTQDNTTDDLEARLLALTTGLQTNSAVQLEHDAEDTADTEDIEEEDTAQPVQSWNRYQDAGGQAIQGQTHVPFAAGQQTATFHIPIWPPLPAAPQCSLEVPPGPLPCRAKVTHSLPNALRLELKLSEPAEEPFNQPLNFLASCTAPATTPNSAGLAEQDIS